MYRYRSPLPAWWVSVGDKQPGRAVPLTCHVVLGTLLSPSGLQVPSSAGLHLPHRLAYELTTSESLHQKLWGSNPRQPDELGLSQAWGIMYFMHFSRRL